MPPQTRSSGRVYSSPAPQHQVEFPPRRKVVKARQSTGSAVARLARQETLTQMDFVDITSSAMQEDVAPSQKRRRRDGNRRSSSNYHTQTLTQLDFVSSTPIPGLDDESVEEAMENRIPESPAKAMKVHDESLMPPPKTPTKLRRTEIPSSESPATPLSTQTARFIEMRSPLTPIPSNMRRRASSPQYEGEVFKQPMLEIRDTFAMSDESQVTVQHIPRENTGENMSGDRTGYNTSDDADKPLPASTRPTSTMMREIQDSDAEDEDDDEDEGDNGDDEEPGDETEDEEEDEEEDDLSMGSPWAKEDVEPSCYPDEPEDPSDGKDGIDHYNEQLYDDERVPSSQPALDPVPPNDSTVAETQHTATSDLDLPSDPLLLQIRPSQADTQEEAALQLQHTILQFTQHPTASRSSASDVERTPRNGTTPRATQTQAPRPSQATTVAASSQVPFTCLTQPPPPPAPQAYIPSSHPSDNDPDDDDPGNNRPNDNGANHEGAPDEEVDWGAYWDNGTNRECMSDCGYGYESSGSGFDIGGYGEAMSIDPEPYYEEREREKKRKRESGNGNGDSVDFDIEHQSLAMLMARPPSTARPSVERPGMVHSSSATTQSLPPLSTSTQTQTQGLEVMGVGTDVNSLGVGSSQLHTSQLLLTRSQMLPDSLMDSAPAPPELPELMFGGIGGVGGGTVKVVAGREVVGDSERENEDLR